MEEALKKQNEAEESKLQLESNLKNIQKTLEETLNSKSQIESQAINKENFMTFTHLKSVQFQANLKFRFPEAFPVFPFQFHICVF